MTEKFTPWNSAEHLRDPGDVEAYLQAAAEAGDPALLALALENVAPARERIE